MRHIIMKSSLLLVAWLVSAGIHAQIPIFEDGIGYLLDKEQKTASAHCIEVGNNPVAISIPKSVKYKETEYTVTSIDDHAFRKCVSLTTIVLPASITRIGHGAFRRSTHLAHIACFATTPIQFGDSCWAELPFTEANVHVKPGCAEAYRQAKGWQRFKNIKENVSAVLFAKINGVIYYLDNTELTAALVRQEYYYSGNLVIPNTVTYKGHEYTVTEIEQGALAACRYDLSSITLPEGLKTIKQDALSGIGAASIYCMATIPPTLGKQVFSKDTYMDAPLYLRAEAKEAYAKAEGWSGFSNVIAELTSNEMVVVEGRGYQLQKGEEMTATLFFDDRVKSLRRITTMAKHDMKNARPYSAVLPARVTHDGELYTVTAIASYSFLASYDLNDIILPAQLTRIGDGAFGACPRLKSITMPGRLKHIGAYAFARSGLETVTIPKEVEHVGTGVFIRSEALTRINVAPGNQYFMSIDGLLCNADSTELLVCPAGATKCAVPESVTKIGNEALHYCNNIRSITLPKSLTYIGDEAFADCAKLDNILSYIEEPQAVAMGKNLLGKRPYSQCTLHVKRGKKDTYRKTGGWKEFTNIKEGLK